MIHEELWKKLNAMDPYDVSRNSLAVFDENSRTFCLKILNRTYLINPKLQSMINREYPSSSSPGYHLQLSAINYLIGSKDIPLVGKWVSEKEFPAGPIFFRGHHAMPARKLEKIFASDPGGFSLACKAFAGEKVEGGDIAFEFYVFPRLPVRLILWLSDEEFPARLSYLFDRSANLHLQLDALWAVGKTLESALLSFAEDEKI